ncbi:shikimate dehydrogenase family protein [Sporobolomyces salmoneus]|uniref:shikimate dehydrogenase family protein n=1 Tax=Sporobolomyces salmoneus TaxID=183962 RepID=UPI00317B4022
MESLDIHEFMKFLRSEECGGSAVTMPHKIAICSRLDDLTQEGREIGACNTVILRKNAKGERILVGHNTDSVGVRESLLREDDTHAKSGKIRPGAVLGAGGACRAAVYALNKWLGCSPIYVVNRDREESLAFIKAFKNSASETFNPELIHVETVEEAEKLDSPAYIVSAVPAFPPTSPEEKQARAVSQVLFDKPEKGVILEMCYHPDIWTELAQIAKDAGWKVVTGEQAMIWQGIEQQLLWLGCELADLPVQEILDAVSKQVQSDKETGKEPPLE